MVVALHTTDDAEELIDAVVGILLHHDKALAGKFIAGGLPSGAMHLTDDGGGGDKFENLQGR